MSNPKGQLRAGVHEKAKAEADRMHPEGCRCTSTDSGGDCDWCRVYYCDHEELDGVYCANCGIGREDKALELAHERVELKWESRHD